MILANALSAIFWRDPIPIAAAEDAVPNGSPAIEGQGATSFADLERRAASGDPEAEFDLGIAYDLGHLVTQDFAAAAAWYRKAAEQGYPPAEFNLGAMYDNGRGVPRNRPLAASWYRRAALHGEARAQFDLGQMYEQGDGVPRNRTQALRWYRLAARHGITAARTKIAGLSPASPPTAPRLEIPLPAAPPEVAEPETSPSTAELAHREYEQGLNYWRGRAVDPDSAVAFGWFSRAAAHGSAMAAFSLAYLYEHGDGTARDLIEAYAWYRLAAATLRPGQPRDAALVSADRITRELEPRQINAAEDRYNSLRSQILSSTTIK
jgi:TPR repeat protein